MNNSQRPRNQLPVGRTCLLLFFLGVGGLGVGSCAKAKAASVPAGPPLSVPTPPARVVAPVEPEPVAAVPEPAPAPATPSRTPPPKPAPRDAEQRPQPAPAQPPAPATPPPAQSERQLRPAAGASTAATERALRETLSRANRDLNGVDYGRLSADGRAQYEQSKRFIQQAEQALKERNLVFATTLADKAAALAAELLGR